MTNHDLASLLSTLAGVCGILATLITTTVTQVQQAVHPGAPLAIPIGWVIASAVIGAVGIFAAQLLRIIANPSPPAGQVSVTAPKEPS